MAKPSTNLLWCIIRLGKDMNWWVKKVSDDIHWEPDSLSVVDPRQLAYLLDLLDPLREYGLSTDTVESAFIPFQIQSTNTDNTVRLVRVNESFFESDELLFALPDAVDEEKGPYAEFIDHITRLRVKFLNDNIEFEQKLTIDELEEQVREIQNHAFMEGRALHVFQEVTDILEFVPEGYELTADEDAVAPIVGEDEEIDVGEGFDLDTDEKIEEDDTMRWDGDEEPEEETKREGAYDLDTAEEDEEEEGDEEGGRGAGRGRSPTRRRS
ncbi:MAG: hypothetical protein LBV54_06660 [Puniceicoccales bacterium]|jgi:hypothetical protein|nr:hypothetical protein [Puniceicoccales bacterium]